MSKMGWEDDDPRWDDFDPDDDPWCSVCQKYGHTNEDCPEDEGDGLTDAQRWGPVPL